MQSTLFRWLRDIRQPIFTCPICAYKGTFRSAHPTTGLRKYARCASCGAMERHRLQFLVLQLLKNKLEFRTMRILHCAPEKIFTNYLSGQFAVYVTADFNMERVDHHVDLRSLPFHDESYDFVFASHVLEHISDDARAIMEVRRILRPGGIAVLPVPIVADKTIEYPEPNPNETGHVRAPGRDYFERFESEFDEVDKYTSSEFPEKYQLFVYEDRSQFPTDEMPLRTPMYGERHVDIVPVCRVRPIITR